MLENLKSTTWHRRWESSCGLMEVGGSTQVRDFMRATPLVPALKKWIFLQCGVLFTAVYLLFTVSAGPGRFVYAFVSLSGTRCICTHQLDFRYIAA
ncbi:hypothetical protein PILCRDRAFT_182763 [Piloderma croceum F 1598]|uniref:Uncharacterized protein n=1 Tax=Piloderma croceum (strain F 1598) TaxID=765440 RepID=A0A0C3BV32_PILCF|nr:hypothetical protein PILCRDRAFT_182763 [Piloderma croceum F 1598]